MSRIRSLRSFDIPAENEWSQSQRQQEDTDLLSTTSFATTQPTISTTSEEHRATVRLACSATALLEHLEGDIAWRDPAQGQAQREKLAAQREQERE